MGKPESVCGSGSSGSSGGKKKKLALKASKAPAVAAVPEIEPSDEQLELEMHQALCRGMFRLVAAGTNVQILTSQVQKYEAEHAVCQALQKYEAEHAVCEALSYWCMRP